MKLVLVTRDGVRQADPETERAEAAVFNLQAPTAEQVRAEAARRIRATGLEQQSVRAFATGRPVDSAVNYLCMQIRFAGEAMAALNPIPADFRQDRYWPS